METTDTAPKRSSVGKTLAKLALTAVSPPIAAITLVDGGLNKIALGGLAIVGSLFSTVMTDAHISGHELYNNPQVNIKELPNEGVISMAGTFLSPILYWTNRSPATMVVGDKSYFFKGDTIIPLNKDTGNYEVSFNESTRFSEQGPKVRIDFLDNLSALTDARKSLDDALSQGYLGTSKLLAQSYETKRTQYEGAKKTLDEVVAKMNAELDEQRSKLAGDKK